jgi:hypothetical protein
VGLGFPLYEGITRGSGRHAARRDRSELAPRDIVERAALGLDPQQVIGMVIARFAIFNARFPLRAAVPSKGAESIGATLLRCP